MDARACAHALLSTNVGKSVCMQFLIVVIYKMAYKIDLGLTETYQSEF